MSNYDINSNPALVKQMIENSKKASEKYFAEKRCVQLYTKRDIQSFYECNSDR